jgi:hypothetical protein
MITCVTVTSVEPPSIVVLSFNGKARHLCDNR